MKKIIGLITTLIFVIILISCKNLPETFVKIEMGSFDNNGTSFVFDLKIEDPDNELLGDVKINITKEGETTYLRELTRTKDSLMDEDTKELTFSSLAVGTLYHIKVISTINEKSMTLLNYSITSKLPDEISITTVEDFFNIKEKRNAKYTLENDLDFADYEDEINDNIISTFTGIFNGNGYSIKNYTLRSSNINLGLFQQLSTNAEVHNLVIDNMLITNPLNSNDKPIKVTGSKRVGFLFGQNTTVSTKISNITIKNSTIDLIVNSESNFNEFGFLGGAGIAEINNINIDNTNTLTINQERLGQTKIGGLLGKLDHSSTQDVLMSEINVAGTINYVINQNNDGGLRASSDSVDRFDANIGGLIGSAKNLQLTNAIVDTKINVLESNFIITAINESRRKDFLLNINIGGLFASSVNVELTDVLYRGSIDLAKFSVTSSLDEEDLDKMRYEYKLNLNVAGLLNNTQIYNEKLVRILRASDLINIAPQEATGVKSTISLTEGVLFTNARNIRYNQETNTFGIIDGIVDTNNQIRIFNNLSDLFEAGSWVLENSN